MEKEKMDNLIMGFNRKNVVEKIINIDFNGDLEKCAKAIGINKKYLHALVFYKREAGKSVLEKIYKYCRKTDRDPEEYIFVRNRSES